jgi:hypothetical protein
MALFSNAKSRLSLSYQLPVADVQGNVSNWQDTNNLPAALLYALPHA